MVFTAKVEDLEIRGKEVKDGKNGEYAVVRFDAENGVYYQLGVSGEVCEWSEQLC